MRQGQALRTTLAILGLAGTSVTLQAAPYASNVVKTGTTVNFILNEPADALTYTINGGAPQALDGTTKGAKMFTLGAAGDTFAISAAKNAATGYSIPTGNIIAGGANMLSQPTNEAGLNIVSDDVSLFTRYNSPRGVTISNDPNAPHFGTTYITNSAAGAVSEGTPAVVVRTLTSEGLYAVRADQSDAFAYGDAAKNPLAGDGFPAFSTSSSNSPYRAFVADNGDIFVADYSDINGTVFKIDPLLTASQIVLAGIGGPAPPAPPVNPDGTGLPAGQNHGSISSVHVEGTFGGGDLVLYGVDEDINSAHFGGAVQNDRNSLWQWNVGSTPPVTGSTVTPTRIGGSLIGDFPAGGILIDMHRGNDGKFYLSQNRSAGLQVGIQVLDPSGAELFNSLTASRTLLNDPAAADIFSNVLGIGISEDQKWLAAMLNGSDVAVVPLVNGIPDIGNRLVVDTGTNVNSGRDITFDAAGNIHYVSSGQGRYRVLSPGGNTLATTTFNGTSFAFTIATVGAEPDADFDGDGDIDGADFLTFQRGLGMAGDQPDGDADGDGFVDADDLAIFRNQFATATPVAGAVPEPSAWALAAVAGLFCVVVALPRRRAALARVSVVR